MEPDATTQCTFAAFAELRLLRDLLVKPPRKYDIMCNMKMATAVISRDIKEVGGDR